MTSKKSGVVNGEGLSKNVEILKQKRSKRHGRGEAVREGSFYGGGGRITREGMRGLQILNKAV